MNTHSTKLPFLILIYCFIISQIFVAKAQDQEARVTFDGYIDIFYAYDFSNPTDHIRLPFLFHFNRHNEVNLNLGLLRVNYENDRVRGSFGLQAGTYAQDNYSAEESLLRNVFEAQIGVALNTDKTLWLDAGIFPSHLGFESAISSENATLSRSLAAENSPYFLSGAKLNYQPNDKITLTGVVANGWQRIARLNGNQTLGFGTQVAYQPKEHILINWSTFIGNDNPDKVQMRYFNDFFITWRNSSGFSLIAGADFGYQESAAANSTYDSWKILSLIAQQKLSVNNFVAARIEKFTDKSEVILDLSNVNSVDITSISFNFDHQIQENAWFRVEFRHFIGDDSFSMNSSGTNFGNYNSSILSSLSLKF
jgi:hypothetical protein